MSEPIDPEELRRRVRRGSPDARRLAGQELAALGAVGIQRLAALLGDDDYSTILAVRDVLARLGEPAVEPLVNLVREGAPREQEAAAETLEEMAEQNPSDALVGASSVLRETAGTWSHAPAEVKTACRRALEAIMAHEPRPRRLVFDAPDAPHADIVERSRADGLRHPSWRRRLDLLTEAEPGSFDPDEVIRLAHYDPEGAVRRAALERLARHRSPGFLPALGTALRDREIETREIAARLLSREGADAIPPLLRLARSGDAPAESIALALGLIGDPAVSALLLAIEGPDPEGREAAARLLGRVAAINPDLRLRRALPILQNRANLWSGETSAARKVYAEAMREIEKQTLDPSGLPRTSDSAPYDDLPLIEAEQELREFLERKDDE